MIDELPKLDYEVGFKEQLHKNIEEMRANQDSSEYIDKVKKFAEKFDLDEKEIIDKYEKDDIFALFFVKDPGRQSYHENAAAAFIESLNDRLNINMFQNFKNLPKSGRRTLYVANGNVIDYETRQGRSDGKSIDFYWEYNYNNKKLKFYASHKHTTDEGGSQDNQRNDVEAFMEGARVNRSNNERFYAITDGPYYDEILSDLNEVHGNSHVKAIRINDLPGDVAKYIKEWLINEFGDEAIKEINEFDYIIKKYNT